MNATKLKILWIAATLFGLTGISNAQQSAETSNAKRPEIDVEAMIQGLTQMANAPSAAKPSIDSAIDALFRLKEFPAPLDVRRDFDANAENQKFKNAVWKMAPDESGFQQWIRFGSQGHWKKSANSLPFTFNYMMVPGKIRFSYVSGNQFVDKTFNYTFDGNVLRLVGSGETIALEKYNSDGVTKSNIG